MAKETTTTRTVKIVDVVRTRPPKQYLAIGKTPVTCNISITTSGRLRKPAPAPSTAMDRLEKAARQTIDTYETIITEEIFKLADKIKEFVKKNDVESLQQAEAMKEATRKSVEKRLPPYRPRSTPRCQNASPRKSALSPTSRKPAPNSLANASSAA